MFLYFGILLSLVLTLKAQLCNVVKEITVDKTGCIYSSGYEEGKYPLQYLSCHLLKADPGKRIRLHFEDFELEATEVCRGDFLRIIDGDNEEAPIVKILCGYERPRDILSTGNVLLITFLSDFMISKRGFHIVYSPTTDTTLCPGQFSCRNRKCVESSLVCNKDDNCEDGSDEANCGNPMVTPTVCGQPTIQPRMDDDERIVGGYEAIPGSWPWQAELQQDLIEPNGHVCGGSLINNQWVLTAAHCFLDNKPEVWRIHLGKHHKFQRDDSEQVRYVERIVFHPEITGEKFELDLENDIALLKLQAPVKFSDKVKTVCLPTALTSVLPGTKCYAMGWGETRGTGGSSVLKQTKLITQESSACNKYQDINESLIVCAGITDGRHGPCHGDSGGPLVCKFNNRWTIVGLASTVSDTNYLGALCAAKNTPTSYIKISLWVDWINRMIRKYT